MRSSVREKFGAFAEDIRWIPALLPLLPLFPFWLLASVFTWGAEFVRWSTQLWAGPLVRLSDRLEPRRRRR